MSIVIPPQLNWLVELTAGQSYPKGDPDAMRVVGDAWTTAQTQIRDVLDQATTASGAMLEGMSGQAAEQFTSFMNSLYAQIPPMSQGAGSVGDMTNDVAVQIEYAQFMILLQMIWMAEQIAEWSSTFFGAAAVPVIEAAGRAAVWEVLKMLAKQVGRSVAEQVIGQEVMSSAVQLLQMYGLHDRTKWDASANIGAAEMGVVSGVLGVGLHLGESKLAPDLVKSLGGHIGLGALNGAVITEVSNLAFGAGGSPFLGAAGGALGGFLGHRAEPGEEGKVSVDKVDIPDVDLKAMNLHGMDLSGFDNAGRPMVNKDGTWVQPPPSYEAATAGPGAGGGRTIQAGGPAPATRGGGDTGDTGNAVLVQEPQTAGEPTGAAGLPGFESAPPVELTAAPPVDLAAAPQLRQTGGQGTPALEQSPPNATANGGTVPSTAAGSATEVTGARSGGVGDIDTVVTPTVGAAAGATHAEAGTTGTDLGLGSTGRPGTTGDTGLVSAVPTPAGSRGEGSPEQGSATPSVTTQAQPPSYTAVEEHATPLPVTETSGTGAANQPARESAPASSTASAPIFVDKGKGRDMSPLPEPAHQDPEATAQEFIQAHSDLRQARQSVQNAQRLEAGNSNPANADRLRVAEANQAAAQAAFDASHRKMDEMGALPVKDPEADRMFQGLRGGAPDLLTPSAGLVSEPHSSVTEDAGAATTDSSPYARANQILADVHQEAIDRGRDFTDSTPAPADGPGRITSIRLANEPAAAQGSSRGGGSGSAGVDAAGSGARGPGSRGSGLPGNVRSIGHLGDQGPDGSGRGVVGHVMNRGDGSFTSVEEPAPTRIGTSTRTATGPFSGDSGDSGRDGIDRRPATDDAGGAPSHQWGEGTALRDGTSSTTTSLEHNLRQAPTETSTTRSSIEAPEDTAPNPIRTESVPDHTEGAGEAPAPDRNELRERTLAAAEQRNPPSERTAAPTENRSARPAERRAEATPATTATNRPRTQARSRTQPATTRTDTPARTEAPTRSAAADRPARPDARDTRDTTPATGHPTQADHEAAAKAAAQDSAARDRDWQDFVAGARAENPEAAVAREWTRQEAEEWIRGQAAAAMAEAERGYWLPFGTDDHAAYVQFHGDQAGEHAWNMVMHDLGIDPAALRPQHPDTSAADHDRTAEPDTPAPDPRELAAQREQLWRDFVAGARDEHPAGEPVRDWTLADADDWVRDRAGAAAAEAERGHWEPFGTDEHAAYVRFHGDQAREHAWDMVMHDLGIDPAARRSPATHLESAPPEGAHRPAEPTPATDHTATDHTGVGAGAQAHHTPAVVLHPPAEDHGGAAKPVVLLPGAAARPAPPATRPAEGSAPVTRLKAPSDTLAHDQAAAAVPRAVGWSTVVGHFLDGAVVSGQDRLGGRELLARIDRPTGPADGDRPPDIALIVCTADTVAAQLHEASGGRVLYPTGEAMMDERGDVLSGTWTVDDELNLVPVPSGDWVVLSGGLARSLGTSSYTEALARLGAEAVPGGPPPHEAVAFFHAINPHQSATLNRFQYDADTATADTTANGPYRAFQQVAGERLTSDLGGLPTTAQMRDTVVQAVRDDLARPNSHYAGLIAPHQDPDELLTAMADPEHWDEQLSVLVPHVLADAYGVDLGVVGPLGHAEAVGDVNGPRRGDLNGDPLLLVNIGDRLVPAFPREARPVPGAAGERGPQGPARALTSFAARRPAPRRSSTFFSAASNASLLGRGRAAAPGRVDSPLSSGMPSRSNTADDLGPQVFAREDFGGFPAHDTHEFVESPMGSRTSSTNDLSSAGRQQPPPAPVRELRPRHEPGNSSPWTAPLRPDERRQIEQAGAQALIPPGVEREAASAGRVVTLDLLRRHVFQDGAVDDAAGRLRARAHTALTDWDGRAGRQALGDLDRAERVRDVVAQDGARVAGDRARHFGELISAVGDRAEPPGAARSGQLDPRNAAMAERRQDAWSTADALALHDRLGDIDQAEADSAAVPPPDGVRAQLGRIHDEAAAAGQRAFDQHVAEAVRAVGDPPAAPSGDHAPARDDAQSDATHDDAAQSDAARSDAAQSDNAQSDIAQRAAARYEEARIAHDEAVRQARQAAQQTGEQVRRQAHEAVVERALRGDGIEDSIRSLAVGSARAEFARDGRGTVGSALHEGARAASALADRARDAAALQARKAAEWRLRQNNALDALVRREPERELPPGFGHLRPDGGRDVPMGRNGRFVRLGETRFTDSEGIADRVVDALPDGSPWGPQVHEAVLGFLADHGAHVFAQRIAEDSVTFPVTDGHTRDEVTVSLDLGNLDLARHVIGLGTETVEVGRPIGQKQHNAVEADHESTSGGRISSGNSRTLGLTGPLSFGVGGKKLLSVQVGYFGLSGSSGDGHSAGADAVSATKRLLSVSGENTYFDIPGAALATVTRAPNPGAARPAGRTPLNLRVGFETELTPLKDAPSRQGDLIGVRPADLDDELAAGPPGPLARAAERIAGVPHEFMSIAESVGGLAAVRRDVRAQLGPEADAGLGAGVDFFLGEKSFLRMSGDIMGPGSTSPLFTGEDGQARMHLVAKSTLLNAQRLTVDPVALKEESQRFINVADGRSQSGGMGLSAPNGRISHTFADGSSIGGELDLGASLGSNRSMNANSGSGHISGLVYNGDSVRYRTTMRLTVDVAKPGIQEDSMPRVTRDVTVYLRIPVHQQARFEASLRRAESGDATVAIPRDADAGAPAADLDERRRAAEQAELDTARYAPRALASGRATGFTAISHLSGAEKVMPKTVDLVKQASRQMPWSRDWDAMDTAYLRRQLASRLTAEGLKNWSSTLFQPGGTKVELFRPAREGTEVITVTVAGRFDTPPPARDEAGPARPGPSSRPLDPPRALPEPTASGRVSSAKLEIMPSAFAGHGGDDSVTSGVSGTLQFGGTGSFGTSHPIRTLGPNAKYSYSRSNTESGGVGASGFMLEAILYDGPARTFDYDVHFDVTVDVRHEAGSLGLNSGWPKVVYRQLTGAAPESATFAGTGHAHDESINGSARFVIMEKLAPRTKPSAEEALATGNVRITRFPAAAPAAAPHGPADEERGAPAADQDDPQGIRAALQDTHTPLNPDDQVMEPLGGQAVGDEIDRMLRELGLDPKDYGTLPWTMTGSETLGSSLVRGPSVISQTLVHGGTVTDRRAVVTVEGFPFNPRTTREPIPIFQMHVAEGNGQVSASHTVVSGHTANLSASTGFFLKKRADGTNISSSVTPLNYSRNFGDRNESNSEGLTTTTGRLTQGERDYHEYTADMAWRVSVVAHDENTLFSGAPRVRQSIVEVTNGLTFLRLADPVRDPRAGGPAPARPAGVPEYLRAGRPDQGETPLIQATAHSAERVPAAPLIPAAAASERLMPQLAADGAAHPLDVTGEGNPVLGAVHTLLRDHASGHLESGWTVAGGDDSAHQVPAKLANLLNVGSLEALNDLLLGPGLVLHSIRSLPLVNERVQIVLKATRDPHNRGYDFLEHVDSANVSRYWFRLNSRSQTRGADSPQSSGHSFSVEGDPGHDGRFAKASGGPSTTGTGSLGRASTVTSTDALRDTFFMAGPAERYSGDYRIEATLTKTLVPSRLLNTGLLSLPAKAMSYAQGAGDHTAAKHTQVVDLVERVLIPSSLLHGDTIAPRVDPHAVAVSEVDPNTPAHHHGTPLGLTPDDLLGHRAISMGFDGNKLSILMKEAVKRFAGNTRPISGQSNAAVQRLMEAGTRSLDSMHYAMSHQVFTRQLEFMLRPEGLTMPRLVREGGPVTDTTGNLNIKVELLDPQVVGHANGWLESVTYGFKEFNQGGSHGSSRQFGASMTLGETSGELGPQPPGTHAQQTPSQNTSTGVGNSRGRSGFGVLKTMPKATAENTKAPWTRVTAKALVTMTLRADNTRDWVKMPGSGEVKVSFVVDHAAEFGLAPETALGLGLTHPRGMPVDSGLFVAAHGASAAHGVADDDVDALRAAFATPNTPDALAVHVRLNGDGDFLVGDRALTAQEFHDAVLAPAVANRDGVSRLILVAGGGDAPAGGRPTPAEALSAAAGLPVLATADDVHITPDGATQALRIDLRDGRPDTGTWSDGRWTTVSSGPGGTIREQHQRDLGQSLGQGGRRPGDRPDLAPVPGAIVSRIRPDTAPAQPPGRRDGPVPAPPTRPIRPARPANAASGPSRTAAAGSGPGPRQPVSSRLSSLFTDSGGGSGSSGRLDSAEARGKQPARPTYPPDPPSEPTSPGGAVDGWMSRNVSFSSTAPLMMPRNDSVRSGIDGVLQAPPPNRFRRPGFPGDLFMTPRVRVERPSGPPEESGTELGLMRPAPAQPPTPGRLVVPREPAIAESRSSAESVGVSHVTPSSANASSHDLSGPPDSGAPASASRGGAGHGSTVSDWLKNFETERPEPPEEQQWGGYSGDTSGLAARASGSAGDPFAGGRPPVLESSGPTDSRRPAEVLIPADHDRPVPFAGTATRPPSASIPDSDSDSHSDRGSRPPEVIAPAHSESSTPRQGWVQIHVDAPGMRSATVPRDNWLLLGDEYGNPATNVRIRTDGTVRWEAEDLVGGPTQIGQVTGPNTLIHDPLLGLTMTGSGGLVNVQQPNRGFEDDSEA